MIFAPFPVGWSAIRKLRSGIPEASLSGKRGTADFDVAESMTSSIDCVNVFWNVPGGSAIARGRQLVGWGAISWFMLRCFVCCVLVAIEPVHNQGNGCARLVSRLNQHKPLAVRGGIVVADVTVDPSVEQCMYAAHLETQSARLYFGRH